MKTNNHNSQLVNSLFRDFKISIIEGKNFEINEDVYNKFIKSDQYEAYKKYCPGEIITGSRSLNLLGLLNREVRDFDIIIPGDYPKDKFGKLSNLMYTPEEFENYIGTHTLSYKKNWFSNSYRIQFDFFNLQENTQILNIKGLKLHHPLQIIEEKIKILDKFEFSSVNKHFKDLIQILK